MLREIRRVLKPGGLFAVSVPRFGPEWICWRLSDAYHEVEGGHVTHLPARELQQAVQNVEMYCYASHWAHGLHSPYWWLRCLFWSSGESNWAVRTYHRFLVWDLMQKPVITRALEALMNPLWGKSVVMYFVRGQVMHPELVNRTCDYIAATQLPSGAIPWFEGGILDPWDHIEAAMGLSTGGRTERRPRPPTDWLARNQHPDGYWLAAYQDEHIADGTRAETNFVAYIATGLWHHYLVTGDRQLLRNACGRPCVARWISCSGCRRRPAKSTGPSTPAPASTRMP